MISLIAIFDLNLDNHNNNKKKYHMIFKFFLLECGYSIQNKQLQLGKYIQIFFFFNKLMGPKPKRQ